MIDSIPGYDKWKTSGPPENPMVDILKVYVEFDPTDDLHPFTMHLTHEQVRVLNEYEEEVVSSKEHSEPLPSFPNDPAEALSDLREVVDGMSHCWLEYDEYDSVNFTWGLA